MFRILVLCIFLSTTTFAQNLAPGGPGKDAQWATAGKQGVGTSTSLESKIWFTLAQGVMTEVYYPTVTVANVHTLQLIVFNPRTKKVETETTDMITRSYVQESIGDDLGASVNSLSFVQESRSRSGDFVITKNYAADPKRNTVLISVNIKFQTRAALRRSGSYDFYVYYDPSLANSGMGDTAWTENGALLARDRDVSSALIGRQFEVVSPSPRAEFSNGFSMTSNGYLGVNDGLTTLQKYKKLSPAFARAENGNVIQVGKLEMPKTLYKSNAAYTLALGFGHSPTEALTAAQESLDQGFDPVNADYEHGWSDYAASLPKVDRKYRDQFNMAAMQLKAHEDKTHRGANIASLSVPWGGGANANENNVGGYHLVWSRDLYQVATAFMALGDKDAANRALDFLFDVQQKADGSFPQNSWLDGKPFWNSLQLDEVAYPLILSHELGRFDKKTYDHVKRAADFIVKNGPATPQERWEEESGYSPSTIAAEISGLVCAAEIAKRNGDVKSAERWLKTADEWYLNIEKWTATTTGKYGDGNYYLRITANGRPDAGDKIEINNGAGYFDEREIVDAGFLELVRLGIKAPDDPLIVKSLKVIDQVIKIDTPHGEAFYRYNHDGYGEMDDGRRWNWDGKYTGKGRLWALLSGERGQYELAKCGMRNLDFPSRDICTENAYRRLDAMAGFANEGLMIPEQVWDKKVSPTIDPQFIPNLKYGEGTGSATPLAWSMAQFIRLATNLKSGRNLDTPSVVYQRYVSRRATR
jgi:glucoamylase